MVTCTAPPGLYGRSTLHINIRCVLPTKTSRYAVCMFAYTRTYCVRGCVCARARTRASTYKHIYVCIPHIHTSYFILTYNLRYPPTPIPPLSSDGYNSRGGAADMLYSNLLIAGVRQSSGFLGIQSFPQIEMTKLHLDRAVNCIVRFREILYLGGQFTRVQESGKKVSYILAYDGASISSLGQGVDGVVHSVAGFGLRSAQANLASPAHFNSSSTEVSRQVLVVGGSFYHAMNLHNRYDKNQKKSETRRLSLPPV
jgi:hypothetical protein